MQQVFRWNIGKREQLGGLLQPLELPHRVWQETFLGSVAKVVMASQNHDLVFVGRSLENMFDFLSGVFLETSWASRCSLLPVSLRNDPKKQNTPEFQKKLRSILEDAGVSTRKILNRTTGIAFVDVVASGDTFGFLTKTLLEWATEESFGQRAVLQKLRFVGVLWQKHTSPNTWRWQQHSAWVKQHRMRAIQNVSLEYPVWYEFANIDHKVTPPNTLLREFSGINREETRLLALTRARQLYELGATKLVRREFAKFLGQKKAYSKPVFGS
jgi:hypothetical protein